MLVAGLETRISREGLAEAGEPLSPKDIGDRIAVVDMGIAGAQTRVGDQPALSLAPNEGRDLLEPERRSFEYSRELGRAERLNGAHAAPAPAC